jgi:hypothetical protein
MKETEDEKKRLELKYDQRWRKTFWLKSRNWESDRDPECLTLGFNSSSAELAENFAQCGDILRCPEEN